MLFLIGTLLSCFLFFVFVVLPQMWHVAHDDGDEEDVEEHELEKAAKYYEDGIEEQPASEIEVGGGGGGWRYKFTG